MMARVFLLGGYDLEMLEIKKLLQEHGEKFIDKELSWGASLSSYRDVFNNEDIFVGIELEVDTQPPKHYVEIDHHGKNIHKQSSIEQIAKILNVQLNRWQELVAANDARYISGMKELCATQEEIDRVRYLDRRAQGVADEDEKLAKESLQAIDNSYIIHSKTQHFSTISDRIYDKFTHYIIYNDNKVVFYGFSIEKLLLFLEKENISPKDYYYGGGSFGFLGIKKGVFERDGIMQLIKEFLEMDKNNKGVISYHTFMLPFTFKGNFSKEMNWQYKPFEIEKSRDYNEYVYFYKHVQDALYNEKEKDAAKFISKYYEYKEQEGTYTISTKNKGDFTLKLDGISLRIFNTNIAILSFNLINDTYHNPEDILAINDFGRRIYPAFLGKEKEYTDTPKDKLLAKSITLKVGDSILIEDFSYYAQIQNLRNKVIQLPVFIANLIESNFENFDVIRPIIDDRMFVISQYNNDALTNKMKYYCDTKGYGYEYEDFWFEYVFVDGTGKTCQSKYMSKYLIDNATYDRWVEWGTLFGISRYSFVVLTTQSFSDDVLLTHTKTMYFQMFSLLLAYRATIIKFSDDIQNITSFGDDEIIIKAKKLYKEYLDFLNKLYFKEVTAQDQGIELYNQAMQIMDIPKYMADLDNEMNELHAYVKMIEEKKTASKMNTLTYIGGALLPPSIITGFFGMNTLGDWKFENGGISFIVIIASGFIIPTLLALGEFLQKENHE